MTLFPTHVGTSGWTYPPWRGTFYPPGLPHRRELEYLSGLMNTVEINGSFYSLQRPSSYQSWAAATPKDFVFAVKGSRFITHMKKLRDVTLPLANFFASGVLALGAKLGPLLWQLPPNLPFDANRLATFFALLPRSTAEAATLAQRHDGRLEGQAWTSTDADRPLRHALEVRHPSYRHPALVELLRAHGVALVVADTAGRWPYLEDITSDFVYVRLHGDAELYVSRYTDEALDVWAQRVRGWQAGDSPRTASPLRRLHRCNRARCSSTSTMTPRCTPRPMQSRWPSGWGNKTTEQAMADLGVPVGRCETRLDGGPAELAG